MENGQIMTPLDRGEKRSSRLASGIKSPTRKQFKLGENNGSPLRMTKKSLTTQNYRLELCEIPFKKGIANG